jgi:hypothetical protein
MIRLARGAIAALALSAASSVHAQSRAARLEVRVEGAAPKVLTATELARLPRVEVRAEEHGRAGRFGGVRLADVLRLAGAPMDSVRGRRATLVVIALAADGYRVAFSLAELASGLGARDGAEVLVADTRDGAPLDEAQGPLRLVVPGDGRPTRWIRQLTTLTVRSAEP